MERTPQDDLELEEWKKSEARKDAARRRRNWKKIEAEEAAIDAQLAQAEATIKFLDSLAKG
jgi:hypothetical protein